MKSVVISIVEFNTKDLLRNSLKSVLDQKWKNDLDVWVVDNASKDDSVEMVKKEFPKVHLIESGKNLGFGAGHNLVFKRTKADYYLILNSDAEVDDGTIDGMVDFMESNNACGIASCKVLGFDNHLQPNGGDFPFGISLLGWLFNLESFGLNSPAFHRNDESYYKNTHEVGWVSGNFMVIRKEVFDSVGLFNDDYFMYFEDVEFCYRAKKAGFKIMINPEFAIKHLSGGSLDDPRLRQWSGEMIGLVKFYRQQFGPLSAGCIKLTVYLSLFLRLIAFALIGNFRYSLIYAKVISSI